MFMSYARNKYNRPVNKISWKYYDLSEIKDTAQRRKVAQAQAALALPERITPEEQKQIDWFDSLFD